ncbi:MAG: M3 family oligoendopeptidase [Chitinophagales bacterium]
MKFNEIPYSRPAIEKFEADFTQLLTSFNSAKDFKSQQTAFKALYQLRDEFDTMYQLANIRYTLDTANETYQKEVDYFDEVLPTTEKLITEFYEALVNATFKKELTDQYGQHIFDMALYKLKAFDPSIMAELQEENRLKSEYTKLKGTAKIDYKGETYNLAGIGKFLVDNDRQVRKEASAARWKFFADNQAKFDNLYDELVAVRQKMAKKLGHENYIDLGYIKMGRYDYNKEMVQNFRQQIIDHIVPMAGRLRARQKARLGYDTLYDYDIDFSFITGNPAPKGSPEEILAKAKTMYGELSPETNEFFNYMLDHDLMDVINRPGKADMGYCWELSSYKHPFIFANFNGTSGDIDVLTHEAGHAFQYFSSRMNEVIEYKWPTSEACEIHSMSMEFLTYPWMESFFEEDADKYFFSHLNKCLLFLPYGCAVDHFQHIVYENPDFTPDQRANAWKEMEALYLPDRTNSDVPSLQSGRFWQKQGHIFESPFYYIDYVLAQICAFQFWQKNQKDKTATWKSYLELCKAGGTAPFLQLVKLAGLKSPFEEGCVASVAGDIEAYLDSIDDSKF